MFSVVHFQIYVMEKYGGQYLHYYTFLYDQGGRLHM